MIQSKDKEDAKKIEQEKQKKSEEILNQVEKICDTVEDELKHKELRNSFHLQVFIDSYFVTTAVQMKPTHEA